MSRPRLHLLWRITYHSLYYFFSLILLLLLCVTPADTIRLAYINRQRFHILIIIVCLSVALAAVVCIYFFRLYVMRTALAGIPRPYIPIDKGDMHKSMRNVIAYGLSRSAAIAFESKPRELRPTTPATAADTDAEDEGGGDAAEQKRQQQAWKRALGIFPLKKAATVEEKMGITLPPHGPVWGDIEHYGWASPNSPDLPNLQYSTVIQELPNLIEAKALTLAPPAPESQSDDQQQQQQSRTLNPEAIDLLAKQDSLGLRQYLAHLTRLGVLDASRTTADFLSAYEYARYSTRPISNARFRELMHLFAEILRTMQPLNPAMLAGSTDNDDGASSFSRPESDDYNGANIDDDAPRESGPSTPRRSPPSSLHRQQRSTNSTNSSSSSSSSSSSAASQIRHHQQPPLKLRTSSPGTWAGAYRTAPTTPKSRRSMAAVNTPSPTSSVSSFAQTRAPLDVGGVLTMTRSNSSAGSAVSGGSVVRMRYS